MCFLWRLDYRIRKLNCGSADRDGGEEAKTSNNIKCPVRSSESVTYDSALD